MSFTVYTREDCRYCSLAKDALDDHDLPFEEVAITPAIKERFRAEGMNTAPQIWHGETHIGGYTELAAYLKRMEQA